MVKTRPERIYMPDEDLLSRIAGGEAALFAILMKRYNQKFYRIARGMGIPDEECDDILQQTYIRIYLKLRHFRGESSAATWMTRILINECLMFRRKKRPAITTDGELEGFEPFADRPVETATPETEMISKELQSLLEQTINELPQDFRIVYIMREIEQMSVKEVAASLGISEANVKVRIHRARKLLEQHLRRYYEPKELFMFGNSRCDAVVRDVLQVIQQSL